MADITTLRAALRRPDYAGLDDATAAAKASVAVRTPKPGGFVTYGTLVTAWGVDAADGLVNTLTSVGAGTGAMAANARTVIRTLTSPGIDPASPLIGPLSEAFVRANLVTQDQLDAVFSVVSYPDGGPCGADDVAAARAANAREDAIDAVRIKWRAVTEAFGRVLGEADSDGALPTPTYADFVAAVTAAQ